MLVKRYAKPLFDTKTKQKKRKEYILNNTIYKFNV